jgi:hypothetical protein
MKYLLLLLLLPCGCRSLPQATVDVNPETHQVTIKNPKDVQFDEIKIRRTLFAVEVIIKGYKSSLNPKAIEAQGKREQKNLEQVKSILGELAEKAAKALIGPSSLAPGPIRNGADTLLHRDNGGKIIYIQPYYGDNGGKIITQ